MVDPLYHRPNYEIQQPNGSHNHSHIFITIVIMSHLNLLEHTESQIDNCNRLLFILNNNWVGWVQHFDLVHLGRTESISILELVVLKLD